MTSSIATKTSRNIKLSWDLLRHRNLLISDHCPCSPYRILLRNIFGNTFSAEVFSDIRPCVWGGHIFCLPPLFCKAAGHEMLKCMNLLVKPFWLRNRIFFAKRSQVYLCSFMHFGARIMLPHVCQWSKLLRSRKQPKNVSPGECKTKERQEFMMRYHAIEANYDLGHNTSTVLMGISQMYINCK